MLQNLEQLRRSSRSKENLKMKGHKGEIDCVEVFEEILVSCSSEDGTIRLWREGKTFRCFTNVVGCCYAKFYGGDLFVGTEEGEIIKMDCAKSTSIVSDAKESVVWRCRVGEEAVNEVDFYKDDMFVCDDNGSISKVDCKTGQKKDWLNASGHAGLCMSISCRPNSMELISGGTDITIKQWSLKSNKPLKGYSIQSSQQQNSSQMCNPPHVLKVCCHPKGRIAAAALGDGRIAICDLENKKISNYIEAHSYSISHVSWMEQDMLCSVGNDKKVCLWKINPRKPKETEKTAAEKWDLMGKPNWTATRKGKIFLAIGKEIHIIDVEQK